MTDTPDYAAILGTLAEDEFPHVLAASARRSREDYFARYGIKAPKERGFAKPGAKNQARARALRAALMEMPDAELAEEILRAYLLQRREMLSAALDHLKIEHVDGLTESDEVNRFKKLSGGALKALCEELRAVASAGDIRLYLRYMGTDTKEVERTLG